MPRNMQPMGPSIPEPSPLGIAQVHSDATDPRSGPIDLTVVIVNYNVREFLEQTLRSVFRAGTDLTMEVFVVDNDSVDGSTIMVRKEFPQVHLIVNSSNVGFGTANNQAMRKARGRYVLVLNPDTIVQEDTLSTMIRFMDEHPEAGAAGCKILHPDGSFALESRRAFPTPHVAFFRMVGLACLFPRSPTFGRYNMTHLPEDGIAEVDALSGSCMMLRREALMGIGGGDRKGAGLFDEDYFMYGEDLDLCYRIQQAGWKIYYTPETEIIHYKGESSRKSELRYVRLFYGAMLRFTEKHFENRYSKLFALVLRCGILARAGVSILAKLGRAMIWPLIDFAVVYACASSLAMAHVAIFDTHISPLFYASVAPTYGLSSVIGIGMTGGYRHRKPLHAVWAGLLVGLLVTASVSFFARDIAFSRLVVLVTCPVGALAAIGIRRAHAMPTAGSRHRRRAILVGHQDEALRLRRMLATHPTPPFDLEGFVTPEADPPAPPEGKGGMEPAWLGRADQLRDLVRLRGLNDVVFASATLSNQTIFRYIQQLRNLAVYVRIFAEGQSHVIGKSSIDDLSTAHIVEPGDAFVHIRSPGSRRLFEITGAVVGLLLHPLLLLAGTSLGPSALPSRLARKTKRLPLVLAGRLSLIGYDETDDYRPPSEWNLRPSVFPIAEVLDLSRDNPEKLAAAYWFYVRNQSASLDFRVLARSLRPRRTPRVPPTKEGSNANPTS